MADFIGKYTKKFESTSKKITKSKTDGYVFGTYRLKLSNGEVISFLKKYFKNVKGISKLSNDDVASVTDSWNKCLFLVGDDKFFSYEREWVKKNYYDKIVALVKDKVDFNERAMKECFYSWSVQKGDKECFNLFNEITKDKDNLSNLELLNLIYDKRYSENKINRYAKAEDVKDPKSSERAILINLLPTTKEVDEKVDTKEEVKEEIKEEVSEVTENVTEDIKEETKETISDSTKSEKSDENKETETKNVKKVKKEINTKIASKVYKKLTTTPVPYRVLIESRFPIYKTPSKLVMITFLNPGVYTIYEEKDGFGRINVPPSAWVDLSMNFLSKA